MSVEILEREVRCRGIKEGMWSDDQGPVGSDGKEGRDGADDDDDDDRDQRQDGAARGPSLGRGALLRGERAGHRLRVDVANVLIRARLERRDLQRSRVRADQDGPLEEL